MAKATAPKATRKAGPRQGNRSPAPRRQGADTRKRTPARPINRLGFAAVVLIATLFLLGNAVAYQSQFDPIDVFEYQCYAHGFWQGTGVTDLANGHSCAPIWGGLPHQFRSFPSEYPAAALTLFSLPLLTPWWPYQTAYGLWLALFVLVVVGVLAWRGPPEAAIAFPLYTLVAGWGFLVQRYDLLVGVCILLMVLLARRDRWRAATVLLAVGTLLKIVPIVLLPLLLIASRAGPQKRPRLDLLGIFAGVCLVVLLPTLILNPDQALGPLRFLTTRPLQLESLPGMLLWLTGGIANADNGNGPLGGAHIALSYNSLNVIGGASAFWSALSLALGGAGLLAAYWRVWRGRDSLGRGAILVLLILLGAGKTASPQYILWLLPTVAVVEGIRLRWIAVAALVWAIMNGYYTVALTALPWTPTFAGTILLRNALLCGVALAYLLTPGDLIASGWPTTPLWRRVSTLVRR